MITSPSSPANLGRTRAYTPSTVASRASSVCSPWRSSQNVLLAGSGSSLSCTKAFAATRPSQARSPSAEVTRLACHKNPCRFFERRDKFSRSLSSWIGNESFVVSWWHNTCPSFSRARPWPQNGTIIALHPRYLDCDWECNKFCVFGVFTPSFRSNP